MSSQIGFPLVSMGEFCRPPAIRYRDGDPRNQKMSDWTRSLFTEYFIHRNYSSLGKEQTPAVYLRKANYRRIRKLVRLLPYRIPGDSIT